MLNPAERNYCTTRKELLEIIFGLRTFRLCLLATHFLLRTDHSALTSLLKSPDPIGQQARWLDLLAEYNFRIEHRAGTQHNNSDSLSRHPCGSRKCLQSDCLITDCSEGDESNAEHRSSVTLKISEDNLKIPVRNKAMPKYDLSLEMVLDAQTKILCYK